MVVSRLRQTKLGEDVAHMLLHRSLGEPELPGDPRVRATFGHQRQHLALACGQLRERIISLPSPDQCLDESRVDDGSASRDALHRLDEFVHVQDATFEQVADPLSGREQLRCLLDLDMSREDEDPGLRKLLADRVRGR